MPIALKNRVRDFIKYYPNETQPSIEQFDDNLYRWAMKVWPRALGKIHEYTRNKYA